MLDRKTLIKELIRYELKNLLNDPELFEENINFFFYGGFSRWTNEALQRKYDLQVKEEENA